MKEQKQITKAEMLIMDSLWSLSAQGVGSADIMQALPDPKPAITTLLTHLKILTEKGFVETEKHGKLLSFTPLISREAYTRRFMKDVKNTFFGGSPLSLLSFFVHEEKLTNEQLDELEEIIRRKKQL